ncbi:MAG: hypothetical protein IPH72_30395 [Sandaracinaceae bacterium]|nr:hypothetical protein [Sandaracinaceae bacterium]
MRSGLRHGPVGRHFQCHPGVSMAGRFPEPVRMWEGATQGHEVTGLRHEGLKFEALGFDLGVMAGRLEGVGRELAAEIDDMPHVLDWGAAVRAEAEGVVRVVRGKPHVFFSPSEHDVRRYRRGLRVMGEMMLAAGADHVSPGVRGFLRRTSRVADLIELEQHGPRRASAYTSAITHMFGTCRMGSDPQRAVVRSDFRHHATAGPLRGRLERVPDQPRREPADPDHGRGHPRGSSRPRRLPLTLSDPMTITLDHVLAMSGRELYDIVRRGAPLDLDALADTTYTGIDLSMPDLFHKLMWKSFRKTFHRDPDSGVLRGWNVKVEQTGWDTPPAPKRDRHGKALTFGHYHVRPAAGVRFPRGWRGGHHLDLPGGRQPRAGLPGQRRLLPAGERGTPAARSCCWAGRSSRWVCVRAHQRLLVLKREGALAPGDVVARPDGKALTSVAALGAASTWLHAWCASVLGMSPRPCRSWAWAWGRPGSWGGSAEHREGRAVVEDLEAAKAGDMVYCSK